MKYDLINVGTGKQEVIHDPELLQKAIAEGSHAFPKGQWIRAFNEYGDYKEIKAEQARDAVGQGYRIATPTQIAVQNYVEENRGLKGLSKVLLGQFADEAAMGIPEMIMNATSDPLEVAKKDALKKEHELANTIGGVAGFGASLFLGGPLFKAGAKAGASAVALRKQIVGNVAEKLTVKGVGKREAWKHARGIVDKLMPYETMDKALAGAVEGGVVTSPMFITEAALGDPETAGEHVLAGVGLGAVFGAGGHLAGKLFKAGAKASGADQILEDLQKMKNADGMKSLAGKHALEAVGIRTGMLDKLKLLKTVEVVAPNGRISYVNKPLTLKDRDEFFTVAAETFLDNKIMTPLSSNAKMERTIDDLAEETGSAIGQKFKALDDEFGERVMVEPSKIADDLESGLLQDLRADFAVTAADENKLRKVIRKLKGSDYDDEQLLQLWAAERDLIEEAIEGTERLLSNSIKEIKTKLPKVFDDLTPDNLGVKRKAIQEAKDHIKNYYGFNNKASRIDENLETLFSAIGYQPVNKTWNGIRKDLDNYIDVLDKAEPHIASLQNDIVNMRTEINELLAESPRNYSRLVSLQEANQIKARFQRRIKQFGRATDQFIPDNYQKVGEYFNREIRRKIGLHAGPERTKEIVELQAKLGNLSEILKPTQKANTKSISLNDLHPNTTAWGAAGGIIGATLGGPVGAVIGGVGGSTAREMVRRYGDQWIAVLLNNKAAGKLAAEYIIKEGAAKQYARIPDILKKLSESQTMATARALPVLGVARFLGDDAQDIAANNRAKQIEKMNEKLSIMMASPYHLDDAIGKLSKPLVDGGAPNIGEALHFKAMNALQYLQSQIPKPPSINNPFSPKTMWIPSDYEMASFERKVSVVMEPLKTIMDEWQNNTLTRDHMEALKAVYPQLYQQIQMRVLDEASKGDGKPLPYEARAKTSLLMGVPLDSTFSLASIQYYQQSFLDKEEQEQGIKANVGDAAGKHMTNLQRVGNV